MRKDLRSLSVYICANKKGKWEADLRRGYAHDTQGHVANNVINEMVDQLAMGLDGIIRSLMSSQTFKGSKFSEVEKTMQAKHLGSKKEASGAKDTFEQTMVAWKRKTRGDFDTEDPISLTQGAKKKKRCSWRN